MDQDETSRENLRQSKGISHVTVHIEKYLQILLFLFYKTIRFIRDSGIRIPLYRILVFAYLVAQ